MLTCTGIMGAGDRDRTGMTSLEVRSRAQPLTCVDDGAGHRPHSRGGSLLKRGDSVSDRFIRFPGTSWQEIEALPQPLRWRVLGTISRSPCTKVKRSSGERPGAFTR